MQIGADKLNVPDKHGNEESNVSEISHFPAAKIYLYPRGQHAKNKKVLGPVKVLVLSFHYKGHNHSDNSRWATDWMK